MKIALAVHDFLKGVGHGRYCIELARRFSREHEVCIFANRFESNSDFSFERRYVPAWRVSAVTSVLSFIGNAERLLREEQFDIVHAQGLCCRRADVITAHVCNAARYRIAPAQTFKERIFPRFIIPRERAFYRSASGAEIIAVSKVVKRELELEYGCSRVSVIYHGVDTSEFAPVKAEDKVELRRKLNLPTNRWIWMFAGEAAKGLSEVIAALADFQGAHLAVVSRSNLSGFERQAKEAGVFERISFVSATDRLALVYQASDVFVYPSRYDTFGLVVTEGMACGLPVVIGKDIGAAEWIHEAENGFACQPEEIRKRLREIADMPISALDEVRSRARKTAMKQTWDECAAQTMEIYRRAIAIKRKSK